MKDYNLYRVITVNMVNDVLNIITRLLYMCVPVVALRSKISSCTQ